jgi:hypothetical protein
LTVVCWTNCRVDDAEAAALGAVPLPLDDLLRSSDIVTLHAPDLPATRHMLDRGRLALIPDGDVLINTSRGALVDHEALTEELVSGRISAVLDAVHQRVTAWWGGSSTPYAPSRTAPSVADGRVGADAPSAGRRLLRQRLGFCGGGVRVSAFVSP